MCLRKAKETQCEKTIGGETAGEEQLLEIAQLRQSGRTFLVPLSLLTKSEGHQNNVCKSNGPVSTKDLRVLF